MESKEKNVSKKSKGSSISIVMYLVASVVALIGVALLVNNILLFKSTVSQAVTQGYDIASVRKALLTSQLLPGIFEPIGIYGGIAFLILGVGIVNKKVSNCLMLLTKVEVDDNIIEENIVEENVVNAENIQIEQEVEKA
ncbi:hypothetical protein LGL55_21120 [Clostridium tagluense]|uniref:hypothetical protein n=1 Tax=Clostridium tagluense TaxID=360422 RepID=UPI001CF20A8D|nr:hypothetical protein [Clostridium tagluense]MCB2313588.1 hypothetical protein [Clostridium tagluense]MCB2318452.1 hypothetical protein [Clostridium tagluense]MCB2323253.1 hypothetical protein [Clostridium tagluense]MCB2328196.1 hypothetical protein [Clostridium tagluense]MCB2332939.1 hypothetical protein [Clostridium tagluense]